MLNILVEFLFYFIISGGKSRPKPGTVIVVTICVLLLAGIMIIRDSVI